MPPSHHAASASASATRPPAQVKSGVQYSLWGGSVLNLGSEAHRRRYYDDIAQLRLPGCFAMTELKHGGWVAVGRWGGGGVGG